MKNFSQRVYFLCQLIPSGKVTTYKELAKALHSTAYRAVGNALNHNPHDFLDGDKTVPCHRVVCSDGRLGGFASGANKKKRLLEKEGIKIKKNRIVNFEEKLFQFS